MQTLTIEDLTHWVEAGGTWQLIDITAHEAVIDFCACTGEPMERKRSTDPAVITWISSAPRPDQDDGDR